MPTNQWPSTVSSALQAHSNWGFRRRSKPTVWSVESETRRKRQRRRSVLSPAVKSSLLSFLVVYLSSFHRDDCRSSIPFVFASAFTPQPSSTGSSFSKETTDTDSLAQSLLSSTEGMSFKPIKALDGLSKFHQSILLRSSARQRFVTGRYPLTVTLKENPTRKWLGNAAQTELLVNGTTPARSLASLDRFLWLDDEQERSLLLDSYAMVSLELLAVIHTERPGYLQILDHRGAGSWMAQAEYHQKSTRGGILGGNSDSESTGPLLLNTRAAAQLPQDRLWVTGFSLAGRKGLVKALECDTGATTSVQDETAKHVLWPNEVQAVPRSLSVKIPKRITGTEREWTEGKDMHMHATRGDVHETVPDLVQSELRLPVLSSRSYQDALLVCDGFLIPGKDFGGIYVVKNPGNKDTESIICLTSDAVRAAVKTRRVSKVGVDTRNAAEIASSVGTSNPNDRWFYHRAVWIDLTGDGRQSILTARCRVSTLLDRDNDVGIMSGVTKSGELVWLECPKPPLDDDGSFDPLNHGPWKTHVLATGPDVMFAVADLDPNDDTVEVIASEFFPKRVSLHSIQRGKNPKVTFSRTIDDRCGAAFGSILADLDCVNAQGKKKTTKRAVLDCGSTVKSLHPGDSFSHLLVTSHECSFEDTERDKLNESNSGDGEIEVPNPNSRKLDGGSLFAYCVPDGPRAWKTKPWPRNTVATGFKVKSQLGNMINPGAPGFVYTFHAKLEDRCSTKRPMIAVAGDCAESAYIFRPEEGSERISTQYKLMVEIKCDATVGSIGVGYDDFTSAEQESGYAKLYVPCFEKDRIHVFALGSGEEDDGW